jgi:hypothetical protein
MVGAGNHNGRNEVSWNRWFQFQIPQISMRFYCSRLPQYNIVLSLFRTVRLPKGINTTYVTLLPKTVDPMKFKDFRPISMIHSIYEIITKILASRLKTVMQDIININ